LWQVTKVSGGREEEYRKKLRTKRLFGKVGIDGEALLLEDPQRVETIKE
jgi:hypothetical protein